MGYNNYSMISGVENIDLSNIINLITIFLRKIIASSIETFKLLFLYQWSNRILAIISIEIFPNRLLLNILN